MDNSILYYYLFEDELNDILKHGLLHTTDQYLLREPVSVVWLTSNQHWERLECSMTDDKRKPKFTYSDFGIINTLDIKSFRIQIDSRIALYNFRQYLAYLGWPATEISKLSQIVYSNGFNPKQWRFSLTSIPSIHFLAIDYWDKTTNEWKPYSEWNPSGSMIYLMDHQKTVQELTTTITNLKSENEKVKKESGEIKDEIFSTKELLALSKLANSQLQKEAEQSKKQYQGLVVSRMPSALEEENKELKEEIESSSTNYEILKDDLKEANKTILEKDRVIMEKDRFNESHNGYINYLQKLLRINGISFNSNFGHEHHNNKAA